MPALIEPGQTAGSKVPSGGVGTALGILIALGVLAGSVGLIFSETAPDPRTLTAAGGLLFAGREPPAIARQPIE